MHVGRKTYSIENTLYKRVKPRACVRSVFESHTHKQKHTLYAYKVCFSLAMPLCDVGLCVRSQIECVKYSCVLAFPTYSCVCLCVYKLGHDILNDTEHKLIYTYTNIYKYMYIFMI